MKWRWLYFLISGIVIVPGLISLLFFGLRPSIDFTGGSILEVAYLSDQPLPSQAQIEEKLGESELHLSSVQPAGNRQLVIKAQTLTDEEKNQLLSVLLTFGQAREERFESVGPTLGRELLLKTLTAAGVAALLITLYVARQFSQLKYGVCAVLAMLHDSLVLLGSFSLLGVLFGVEVDVLFVTALMTTLSFSVHDTIVVYDRIRELQHHHGRVPYPDLVDLAVLQTLGRSINNSMTIIMMLLTLVLIGGSTIHWFAVALLIGAVTGTYSSTFTAAPLLLLWDDVVRWRRSRK